MQQMKKNAPRQRPTERGAKQTSQSSNCNYSRIELANPTKITRMHDLEERQAEKRSFGAGFALGLALGLLALVLVVFLWAIPTVDGCLDDVNQMRLIMAEARI